MPTVAPVYRSCSQRLGAYAGAAIATLACVLAGSASYAQPATAESAHRSAQVSPAKIESVNTGRASAALQNIPAGGVVSKAGQEVQEVPAVEDCGLGKSQVRPKSLVLTCADGNDLGKDLVWSKWGPNAAYATGVDTWNACKPYCAASKTWYGVAATFALSKPVHTTRGWLFERLTVHLNGPTPQKMQRVITFSEAPTVNT